jgi:N-methylhydantoinase A
MAQALRAGIDVGGTFTDGVLLDGDARLHVAKVATNPANLAQGFVDTLSALEHESGVDAQTIGYLAHGTTVATNAILQAKTARIGLLTTAGFRDVLEIGTQQRANLYDLRDPKKAPLVPRELRLEARERIGPEGQVWEPLSADGVRQAAAVFREAAVEAVAVSFLFSFVNAAHEEEARRLLASELPGVPVSVSSEVASEFREYLRTSTTVVNAALLPLVGRYVEALGARLTSSGATSQLHLMQSNGGVTLPAAAARLPVALIASGPAAGVIAAARLGDLAGSSDVLGFDMGGTTADVSLVVGGRPQMRFRGEAAGLPVNLPQIDVLSVGAGGGSIARVDRFGSLAVGPESAGADPGPAAYGRGGEEATVTDAHVVLGTLDPARFLGGRMPLDAAAARRALERRVCGPLGFGLEEAASAVVRIANAAMVRALRVITVARGHDPRRFALVAFGGAGPMHACAIASELMIARVIVPRYPGVASALGLILSDVRHDLRQTWVRRTKDLSLSELQDRLAELEREAQERLTGAGFADFDARVTFELDMRYRGQAYELTVPVAARRIDEATLRAVEGAFHDMHRQAYGHDSPVEEVEIVTLRANATDPVPPPRWDGGGGRPGREVPATGEREIWTPGRGRERYAVYERAALGEGGAVDGPAIVEQDDSTVVVESGWRLTTGAAETAVLERRNER